MNDLTDAGNSSFRLRNGQKGDVTEILQIYNGFFPETGKTEAWWLWWYGQNPAGESIQVLAETLDGNIIGMIHMAPVRLWHAGELHIVAQDSLANVHPDYQAHGIFSAVANELHRQEAPLFPFNFSIGNNKSMSVLTKNAGCILKGVGSFYEKPLEPKVRHTHFALKPIQRFKEEHNKLWNSVRSRVHTSQVRDTRYLNWRFAESMIGKDYLMYDVLEGGRLFGYLVLQIFRTKVDLLDYCLMEGSGLGDIDIALDLLEQVALEVRCTKTAFWALDIHTDVTAVLRRRGYTRVGREFFMMLRDFSNDQHTSELKKLERWSYTAGDMELF